MNEETKSPITTDVVTEQDKGRCAPAPGSETAHAVELAIGELERSRWALERKEWILARVYASQALQWMKAAERDEETEQSPNARGELPPPSDKKATA